MFHARVNMATPTSNVFALVQAVAPWVLTDKVPKTILAHCLYAKSRTVPLDVVATALSMPSQVVRDMVLCRDPLEMVRMAVFATTLDEDLNRVKLGLLDLLCHSGGGDLDLSDVLHVVIPSTEDHSALTAPLLDLFDSADPDLTSPDAATDVQEPSAPKKKRGVKRVLDFDETDSSDNEDDDQGIDHPSKKLHTPPHGMRVLALSLEGPKKQDTVGYLMYLGEDEEALWLCDFGKDSKGKTLPPKLKKQAAIIKKKGGTPMYISNMTHPLTATEAAREPDVTRLVTFVTDGSADRIDVVPNRLYVVGSYGFKERSAQTTEAWVLDRLKQDLGVDILPTLVFEGTKLHKETYCMFCHRRTRAPMMFKGSHGKIYAGTTCAQKFIAASALQDAMTKGGDVASAMGQALLNVAE